MTSPTTPEQPQTEAERLAVCPFCASADVKLYEYPAQFDHEPSAFVQCKCCGTGGPEGKSGDAAIAAWNSRASQPGPASLPDWIAFTFPNGGVLEGLGLTFPTPVEFGQQLFKRWRAKFDQQAAELAQARAERDGLRAARMAYASEFPLNADGEPDVGSIHANIRALKAELEGLKAQRWLPIETAPKDGVEFIAYKPKIGQLIVTYLDADHPDYGGDTPHVTWDYQDLWDATHWMPLPAPPTGEV